MEDCENLLAALFGNPAREHIDIKFFMGGSIDLESADVCREAGKMLAQMDLGEGSDETFIENFEQVEAGAFLASV